MALHRIHYTVNCLNPGLHIYRLTLQTELPAGRHTLTLPAWTPGSYRIQDFSRHLFDLTARVDGLELPVTHSSKNAWEFVLNAPGTVTVTYAVFAFELTVRDSHLDETHAYWNGAQLFLLPDDLKDWEALVEIQAPPRWYVSTGLDRVDENPYLYRADNYDVLIDSPVEVGTHRISRFWVDEKPHTIAVWGHGNEDLERLTADVKRIVESERDLFGSLPYRHYTFILHLTDKSAGGLEHLNSNTCNVERFMFRPDKNYRRVLKLIAHEFFHLWNVKRIHPEALGPFDYHREVYTRLLWAMEGITDYYAGLTLCRGGLITPQKYLEGLGERIRDYEKRPGRFVQSLSESSFDTWIKLYRPDADSPNRTISYYLKGDLVGMCLDLEIRRRTENRHSLDDVLTRLYERYGQHGTGFPEHVYQETVEEVVGGSMADFFARYIDGVEALPIEQYLHYAGIAVERTHKNPNAEDGDTTPLSTCPWLGVDTKLEEGQLRVTTSYDTGPAAALLYPGDQLLALNRIELKRGEDPAERIRRDFRVGDTVMVALFRRGELLSVPVTLAEAPFTDVKVVAAKEADAEQKAFFQRWLNVDWPAVS